MSELHTELTQAEADLEAAWSQPFEEMQLEDMEWVSMCQERVIDLRAVLGMELPEWAKV